MQHREALVTHVLAAELQDVFLDKQEIRLVSFHWISQVIFQNRFIWIPQVRSQNSNA
jgi:hypothetical protein